LPLGLSASQYIPWKAEGAEVYSSLDKVDIVIEEKDAKVAVQTDHRDAAEIESDWDRSVLFGLARIANPVRGKVADRVRVVFMQTPPAAMVELCRLAGAEVEIVSDGTLLPPTPDLERARQIGVQALRSLGSRVLGVLPADDTAIEALQRYFQERVAAVSEDDEITRWEAVLDLGAGVGEVILRSFGGRWVADPDWFSTVPFVHEQAETLTNVFGKVEKYLQFGESEAPLLLLRMLRDSQLGDGPAMYSLRPHDWAGREHGLVLPLGLGPEVAEHMPLVAMVRDMPNTVKTISKETPAEDVERLRAEAEENLRDLEVRIAELEAPNGPVLVVHGGYYASEKLLDRAFLRGIHERLAAGLLLAAVPRKGQLWLTSGVSTLEHIGAFMMIVQKEHGEAVPNERISPIVFVVTDGALTGIARATGPDEPPAEPKKRGLWGRVFGTD
jgi:hypothetical protein